MSQRSLLAKTQTARFHADKPKRTDASGIVRGSGRGDSPGSYLVRYGGTETVLLDKELPEYVAPRPVVQRRCEAGNRMVRYSSLAVRPRIVLNL